jgi:hypothetical protein
VLHERDEKRVLEVKLEAKRLLYRGRHRCEKTIEMELKEMGNERFEVVTAEIPKM